MQASGLSKSKGQRQRTRFRFRKLGSSCNCSLRNSALPGPTIDPQASFATCDACVPSFTTYLQALTASPVQRITSIATLAPKAKDHWCLVGGRTLGALPTSPRRHQMRDLNGSLAPPTAADSSASISSRSRRMTSNDTKASQMARSIPSIPSTEYT